MFNPLVNVIRIERPIDEATFRFLLQFVQPEKKERILRQRIKQNADNMLVGTILAKYMIFQIFHIPMSGQVIAYGDHGKPYLQNNPNIHFNISHSGQFVACALYDKSVGIDIQEVFPYHADIAQRICNRTELEQIRESSEADIELTKIWAQKEACLKMCGCGIVGGMKDVLSIPHISYQMAYFRNIIVCVAFSNNIILR